MAGSYKRLRNPYLNAPAHGKRVRTYSRVRSVPGYTRKVGNYGRYAGARSSDSELKFHDVDGNLGDTFFEDGVILNTSSINLIPQGVTESQRIGRKCTIKAIQWKGSIRLAEFVGSSLQPGMVLRMMVLMDKQCNGAAPTVTGVLETAHIYSYLNLVNSGRFKVLSDKTYRMDSKTSAGNGAANDNSSTRQPFNFYKKCNIPLEFDGATGAITEIRSNNLFILLIGEGIQDNMSLESKIRLRFTDGN